MQTNTVINEAILNSFPIVLSENIVSLLVNPHKIRAKIKII